MTDESIAFLNANRHHYELFEKAQFIRHLDGATRQGLLDVIRKEFSPGYIGTLWCGQCVVDMLVFAYQQYDKWLAEQPINVHANFPSHKTEGNDK